jgi:hypothetical protein
VLRVATNHPSSLVVLKRAIKVVFDIKHPLAKDNIDSRWPRNETPSLVLKEGSNVLFHGGSLVGVS